jgi:hypothetical protein
MKKVLAEVDPSPALNFWRLIHGSFMDLPVLDWCKIFGSNAEPTHWKGVVDDPNQFRLDLLADLKISKEDWEQYWNQMKSYRDELVAHFEAGTEVANFPDLNIAMKSSCFYYNHLYVIINEGKIEHTKFMEDYAEKFYKQAKEIAIVACASTKGIRETVY